MKKLVSIAGAAALLGAFAAINACGGDQQVVMPDTGILIPDGGSAGKTVKVTYNGSSTMVDLSKPTPVTVSGASYDRLTDVVALALPNKSIDQLVATNFIGSDGFTPQSKSNCNALLPLSSVTLAKGYIDPATRNLKWDDTLVYPGCMIVKDTAEIVVADANAQQPDASVAGPDASVAGLDASVAVPDAGASGKTVKVTYNGNSTDVSLDQPTAITVAGASVDKLSDVIAIVVTGKTADQLNLTGIVGSDGFNPATKGGCKANFPLDGAKLPQGYVDRASRNVTWDSALAYPGCMGVTDTAELQVADK